MSFAWPWMALCLLIPWLVRLLPAVRPAAESALPLPFFAALSSAVRDRQVIWRKRPWALACAALIWILLTSAAMRPQWLGEPVSLPLHGRDILLLIDLSGSMEIEDMTINGRPANRLQAIKDIIAPFIERRVNDRLGLILFGDAAYVQAPLTFDRETVRQFLLEAEIGLAGTQTAIGDAIGLALKRFSDRPTESATLILLTDGQNNAGEVDPLSAAALAAQSGLKIHTIGLGADEMIVRNFWGRRRVNPSADLDETALIRIAEKTGGRYFRARSTPELAEIYAEIDRLEPVADEAQQFRPRRELYPYPLAGVAILGLGWMLVSLWQTRRKVV